MAYLGLDFRFFMGKNSPMRTGRPPKPPEERKSADVKIPLTEAEKSLIWEAANIDDAKPVPWSRKIILDAARRRVAKHNGRSGN